MKKTGDLRNPGKFCNRFRKSITLEQSAVAAYCSLDHLRNVMTLLFWKMFYEAFVPKVYFFFFIDDRKQTILSCRRIESEVDRCISSVRPDWRINTELFDARLVFCGFCLSVSKCCNAH